MNITCPICNNSASKFHTTKFHNYFSCSYCSCVFMPDDEFLDPASEKARYDTHNNDVNDKGYQNFVQPIVDTTMQLFTPAHQGLDFGAGPGPVITKLLSDNNYDIETYDPFYDNRPQLLSRKYDYIICCEVIEHFHNPMKEFSLLKKLLKPAGILICKTDIYDESVDFSKWYYKNDRTHVMFYHKNTLQYIGEHYNFKCIINNRIIKYIKR